MKPGQDHHPHGLEDVTPVVKFFTDVLEAAGNGSRTEARGARMGGLKGPAGAHLRVARPTDDLDAVIRFYRDGVGFDVLSEFHDHDGFDGVMLGHAGAGYHLEFTRKRGLPVGRVPTEDNLLVFYMPDRAEWEAVVARMEAAGHSPAPAFNPYWDRHGRTFADPDGYRVVFQNAVWSPRGG